MYQLWKAEQNLYDDDDFWRLALKKLKAESENKVSSPFLHQNSRKKSNMYEFRTLHASRYTLNAWKNITPFTKYSELPKFKSLLTTDQLIFIT